MTLTLDQAGRIVDASSGDTSDIDEVCAFAVIAAAGLQYGESK